MKSTTCPKCGNTSHNRHDVEQGYCGFCSDWTQGEVTDLGELDHDLIKRTAEQRRDARWWWLCRRGIAFSAVYAVACFVGANVVSQWFSIGLMLGSVPTALFFTWLHLQLHKL